MAYLCIFKPFTVPSDLPTRFSRKAAFRISLFLVLYFALFPSSSLTALPSSAHSSEQKSFECFTITIEETSRHPIASGARRFKSSITAAKVPNSANVTVLRTRFGEILIAVENSIYNPASRNTIFVCGISASRTPKAVAMHLPPFERSNGATA